MDEKVFATIVLVICIGMAITSWYLGGRAIEEKNLRIACGLFACGLIFLIVIMGLFL